eukprot:285094_1
MAGNRTNMMITSGNHVNIFNLNVGTITIGTSTVIRPCIQPHHHQKWIQLHRKCPNHYHLEFWIVWRRYINVVCYDGSTLQLNASTAKGSTP